MAGSCDHPWERWEPRGLIYRCGVCGQDVIAPQPGPQTTFLHSRADIAFYGGAKGGGKTYALVLDAGRWAGLSEYRAVLFRRVSTELKGSGNLWDTALAMYPSFGGVARDHPNLDVRFPSGARVEFRHLQHEKDALSHDGRQYAFIGFDQVEQFTQFQFWRVASTLRSISGVRPYLRATLNPEPDHWTRSMVDWWIGEDGLPIPERSGVLRYFVRDGEELRWADDPAELEAQYPGTSALSFTFVPASLDDNPALTDKDPGYRTFLMQMPMVERERLLGGNWNVRPDAGNYFRRGWFRVVESVDELPAPPVDVVRAWDKAASEPSETYPDPDWTRGAKVARLRNGDFAILHIEGDRTTPGRVEQLIANTAAADGKRVAVALWEDPGAAGKADADRFRRLMTGYRTKVVKAALNKQQYAEVWSPLVEHGRVHVVRGPWNEALFNEAEAFPDGGHDDQIDAVSLAFQLLTGGASRLRAAMEQV